MGVSQVEEAQKYKEEGNEAFKNNDMELAIKLYTKAINLSHQESRDLAVYLKTELPHISNKRSMKKL